MGRHLEFNAQSRGLWEGFTDHRARVTRQLEVSGQPGRSRLCILGAGNCNDLDLPALLKAHGEVSLVDLDHEALARAVERQRVSTHPSLHRLAGIDLTGMLDRFAAWSTTTPIPPRDLTALVEEPTRRVLPALPGPFDLVASTCLLSPLIGNAFHSVGETHPQFMAVVQSIRAGHLRLLARLAAPGAQALLITDVISSERCPELPDWPDAELPERLAALGRDRNHFHGLSPDVLWSTFEDDPVLHALVAERESLPPWRWRLHNRVYLVWAIRFKTAPGLLLGKTPA
jgi:hypothetical protein